MARLGVSLNMAIALASSIGLHAIWLARDAKASFAARDAEPTEVLLEAEPRPAPPPPEPSAEPQEPEQAEDRQIPAARHAAVQARAAAPQSAAQAGKTLTAPDVDDGRAAVADFTMVQGSGLAYGGGTTSATGTSTSAVRGAIADRQPAAAPAAPVQAPAAIGPDRSRGARPASADWNCSRLFPTDPEAGNQAYVLIAVTVLPSGAPRWVAVLRDPGHGFGAAAKACALGQPYEAALDRDGHPVAATTPPITVRFTR